MKYLLPKSHRIKHKMLQFLSKERMKNGGLNKKESFSFTLREIAENINEKYEDVYCISDYLFYKKLVYFYENKNEITNPYCWVSDSGIELFSSFSLINDGKILNTNLYGNIISMFFTIILGIITIITVYSSYQKTKELEIKLNGLQKQNTLIEKQLLNLSKEKSMESNSDYTKVDYQTKTQKRDK